MPNLPSGTVTFLFSDIEGSTALLKQLGDAAYTELLASIGGSCARPSRATTGKRSTPRATRSSTRSRARGRQWWRPSRCSARMLRTPGRAPCRCGSGSASIPVSRPSARRATPGSTSSARRGSRRSARRADPALGDDARAGRHRPAGGRRAPFGGGAATEGHRPPGAAPRAHDCGPDGGVRTDATGGGRAWTDDARAVRCAAERAGPPGRRRGGRGGGGLPIDARMGEARREAVGPEPRASAGRDRGTGAGGDREGVARGRRPRRPRSRRRSAGPATKRHGSSVADEIDRLRGMRDEGALSEEQYRRAVDRVVGEG